MARRRRAEIRKILPDPRHNSVDLAKFINSVMQDGKKTVAQRIVYSAMEKAESEAGIQIQIGIVSVEFGFCLDLNSNYDRDSD